MSILKNRSKAAKKGLINKKRCGQFSISINDEYDQKLSKLSVSCGMSKSEMSDQLLRIALDSPNVINWLQDQFNQAEENRIRPILINKKVFY